MQTTAPHLLVWLFRKDRTLIPPCSASCSAREARYNHFALGLVWRIFQELRAQQKSQRRTTWSIASVLPKQVTCVRARCVTGHHRMLCIIVSAEREELVFLFNLFLKLSCSVSYANKADCVPPAPSTHTFFYSFAKVPDPYSMAELQTGDSVPVHQELRLSWWNKTVIRDLGTMWFTPAENSTQLSLWMVSLLIRFHNAISIFINDILFADLK